MAVTWTELKTYIGKKDTSDDDFIESCFDLASGLVSDFLTGGVIGGSQVFRPLPVGLQDRCVLVAGKELFKRRGEPSGQGQYATVDGGVPVRAPLDPMTAVRPLLARYVCPF